MLFIRRGFSHAKALKVPTLLAEYVNHTGLYLPYVKTCIEACPDLIYHVHRAAKGLNREYGSFEECIANYVLNELKKSNPSNPLTTKSFYDYLVSHPELLKPVSQSELMNVKCQYPLFNLPGRGYGHPCMS